MNLHVIHIIDIYTYLKGRSESILSFVPISNLRMDLDWPVIPIHLSNGPLMLT